MLNLQTEILMIGGGATGTGLVRDLAMRGFKTILVERGDLATGTTGRYHGLLHSGGRYVVKDSLAAKECIEENQILRRIMPECIEDTGGFFVQTPLDDPAYANAFIQGCRQIGIPCEEISVHEMLRAEPLLNPKISRCFRVPDASADSFLAADRNAQSARQYEAKILRYHTVIQLITRGKQDNNLPNTVCGAICHDQVKDEEVRIDADLVINAAGAWAGKIAASAGITVQMTPGKGILMAINHRVVNTVINRCKLPGDGDIIVPAHTVAVIGTTDVKVADPDHFGIETWEVQRMLDEGEKLIPGFHKLRFLRAWEGVRPLYQESTSLLLAGEAGNREITRAFVLLDHRVRDGVDGLLTITGGKWTTYRKMAEVAADKACEKLGVQRPCRTHIEPLPNVSNPGRIKLESHKGQSFQGHFHQLGHRLAHLEASMEYGDLICECELATRNHVVTAILEGRAQTLDDIRRDVRLGMGPCQAGFCSLRSAGLLHQLTIGHPGITGEIENPAPSGSSTNPNVSSINVALRDFLQERWKGARAVLWGQQLRQERFNELVYVNVLNTDHLPGPKGSSLGPSLYEQESESREPRNSTGTTASPYTLSPLPSPAKSPRQPDILVIGAGLSGLTAAWRAAEYGKKVIVIAKGWGATHWASGCIDVLGYYPAGQSAPVDSPLETLDQLIREQPNHPYAITQIDKIILAMRSLQVLFDEAGYPLHGSIEKNWLLPTALGAPRPTCLAPETMIAGDLVKTDPTLIVGFEQYLDFFPSFVADNLKTQGIPATSTSLDLTILKKRKFINAMILAHMFDQPEFRAEVVKAIKPRLSKVARIGFPAVLGLHHPLEVVQDLQEQLGCRVFEIPGLPPSVPGIRIHNLLVKEIQHRGGLVYDGFQVINAHALGKQLQAVLTETGTRQAVHQADTFILATGGILGGGFSVSPPGYAQNRVTETALGLPIYSPADQQTWLQEKFLGESGHPVFNIGCKVNSHFQPVDDADSLFFDNLFVTGGALGNCDPIRERSLEGLAVVTAFTAMEHYKELTSRGRQQRHPMVDMDTEGQ